MKKHLLSILVIILTVALAISSSSTITQAARPVNDSLPPQTPTKTPLTPAGEPAPEAADSVLGPNDQVFADDLIVTGSICAGFDCLTDGTESFGYDTFRLKENNLAIAFDDTSAAAGFPANDWRIVINDSAPGGANYFSIQDSTASTVPFKVMAGAPNASLYIAPTGNLGLGTAAPAKNIHINSGNNPTIRLEQNNSGGYSAYTWDIAANETNYFVRDVNSSNLVFRLMAGAPANSLVVAASGNVGLGVSSPSERLQVDGNILLNGYVKELSDRNAKTAFAPVNGAEVLAKLAQMPVTSWSYKAESGVRHIGPVAQDFYAAFGLGQDDTHLAALDVNGVSLAAIQTLDSQLKTRDVQIAELEGKLSTLEIRLSALEAGAAPAGVQGWLPALGLGLLGLIAGFFFTRRKD